MKEQPCPREQQSIRRAYDYGMTRRQVLEAISCVFPMSGMITGQLGLRAMRLADAANRKEKRGKGKGERNTARKRR